MKHELKIWPQFFEAVLDGSKTFEYRVNDRGFQKGDIVNLHEWDPATEKRTGRMLEFKIGYVLPVSQTNVVFSLLERSE